MLRVRVYYLCWWLLLLTFCCMQIRVKIGEDYPTSFIRTFIIYMSTCFFSFIWTKIKETIRFYTIKNLNLLIKVSLFFFIR